MKRNSCYVFEDSQEMQDTLAQIVSHALSRIEVLKGRDRICLTEEYKEWLGEDFDNEVMAIPEIKQKL